MSATETTPPAAVSTHLRVREADIWRLESLRLLTDLDAVAPDTGHRACQQAVAGALEDVRALLEEWL